MSCIRLPSLAQLPIYFAVICVDSCSSSFLRGTGVRKVTASAGYQVDETVEDVERELSPLLHLSRLQLARVDRVRAEPAWLDFHIEQFCLELVRVHRDDYLDYKAAQDPQFILRDDPPVVFLHDSEVVSFAAGRCITTLLDSTGRR